MTKLNSASSQSFPLDYELSALHTVTGCPRSCQKAPGAQEHAAERARAAADGAVAGHRAQHAAAGRGSSVRQAASCGEGAALSLQPASALRSAYVDFTRAAADRAGLDVYKSEVDIKTHHHPRELSRRPVALLNMPVHA